MFSTLMYELHSTRIAVFGGRQGQTIQYKGKTYFSSCESFCSCRVYRYGWKPSLGVGGSRHRNQDFGLGQCTFHLLPPRCRSFDDFRRIPWLLLICEFHTLRWHRQNDLCCVPSSLVAGNMRSVYVSPIFFMIVAQHLSLQSQLAHGMELEKPRCADWYECGYVIS